MNSRMALEIHSEPRPQFALDRVDQAGEQGRRGEPLPLGQPGRVGQQQIGRGHGKTLARRGQQQARGIALFSPTVSSGFGHDFSYATQG